MGPGHHNQRHQATDGLVSLFAKANHDLSAVQFKLEREFRQVYPDNANPMQLVSRIKEIQEDLTTLKEQCSELLTAKQDLIDKARTVLVGNRNLIHRMQQSTGVPLNSGPDDLAFSNFEQIVDEWTAQIRSRTGDENQDAGSEHVNKLLFSAIVQSS